MNAVSKSIALLGTLDTKGQEIFFMKNLVEAKGYKAVVIDTGIMGNPSFKPDVERTDVLREIGLEMSQLISLRDLGKACEIMSNAVSVFIKRYYEERIIDGLIAVGGGTGSAICAKGLQQLPIGFPKVLASTKAIQAGIQTYAGTKDVVILPTVCDIAGLNWITKRILSNAVGMVIGMIEMPPVKHDEKPLIVMSMNGGTTECGLALKDMLTKDGYEIIIFHSLGPGGRAMEEFIIENNVVFSIETGLLEITNELFGGMASAGKERLEAAGRKGIPQIVVPGTVEVLNFLGLETVPEKYRHRRVYTRNISSTVVRMEEEELGIIAKVIAEKVNKSKGITEVLIPLRGFSNLDVEGGVLYDSEADRVFVELLKANLAPEIQVFERDFHINDKKFSEFIYERFLDMSKRSAHRAMKSAEEIRPDDCQSNSHGA